MRAWLSDNRKNGETDPDIIPKMGAPNKVVDEKQIRQFFKSGFSLRLLREVFKMDVRKLTYIKKSMRDQQEADAYKMSCKTQYKTRDDKKAEVKRRKNEIVNRK
jgi:hypothetical protein